MLYLLVYRRLTLFLESYFNKGVCLFPLKSKITPSSCDKVNIVASGSNFDGIPFNPDD